MTNEQVTAARRAMKGFPSLKVTIGGSAGAETLTPYEKDDVFSRGAAVAVTESTPASQITQELSASCAALLNG